MELLDAAASAATHGGGSMAAKPLRQRVQRLASFGLIALVFAASGCVTYPHGRRVPAPHPAPHPQTYRIDAATAQHITREVALERGYYNPQVRDLKWKDPQFRWEVKAYGYVAGKKAKLDLWIDGDTGDVIKLKDNARRKHHRGGHYSSYPAPPPHPPHGHRQHHAGVELIFDSGLGLYVVVGWHDHFFYEGHFYRHIGDVWQQSTALRGHWQPTGAPSLPPGLAKKHKRGKGHKKHRNHPAKYGR